MHIFYVSINMFVNAYVKTDHMADMKYTNENVAVSKQWCMPSSYSHVTSNRYRKTIGFGGTGHPTPPHPAATDCAAALPTLSFLADLEMAHIPTRSCT